MNNTNPVRFIPHGLIPTEEQLAIQLSQRKVTLIEANAGAAKTTTLALRIGEAIARGLPPEKILALTFTPEAKDVMKTRLLDLGIPQATIALLRVQTFEEFAETVLRNLEEDIPPHISAKDQKLVALEAINRVSEHYLGQVDYLDIRTHNIAISQFIACQLQLKATLSLEIDVQDMGLEEIARQLDVPLTDYLTTLEYENIRLGNNDEILFRGAFDATYDLARNLVLAPETQNALPHFGLVVCDELHDVNEASFQILVALLAIDKLYFVGAGDKDQVIYSKLGADAMFLRHRFNDLFPSTVRLPLTMTYRHGPHLAYATGEFKNKKVDSNLPLHTEIKQLHYGVNDNAENGGNCADRVVDAINKWKSEKYPLETCAILLRDRHQAIAIENALVHAKIAYRTLSMQSYLQCDEILFLRGMIAIALDNLSTVKSTAVRKEIIDSLILFGELEYVPKEMGYDIRDVSEVPGLLRGFFSGRFERDATEKKASIVDAVNYMKELPPETSAAIALEEVCNRMDLKAVAKRIYINPYDAAIVSKSIDGFIEAAQQSKKSLREFSEWITLVDSFYTSRKSKDLVVLDCVSNAKGKEFNHVILPFLENGEFPNLMKDHKEEENLFYVGITRAKLRLTLISPSDGNNRSAFIQRMALPSSKTWADAAVEQNQSRTVAQPTRIDLAVAYADRDIVKALGAQWDVARKVWWVKPGSDIAPFRQWLPKK